MTPEDFKVLSELIYKRAGIVLSKEKIYLLETRLKPVARARGMNGLEELAAKLRAGRDEALASDVTEAMTTNETLFFRDIRPFNQFRELILPHLLNARSARRKIRVWCAACSTGQEPYSLAMIIKDADTIMKGWRVDIVGTDLSREALEKAKVGIYSQFEVQRGLPVQMLMKYFQRTNETWQVDSAIRAMVNFHELNLLKDFSTLGNFDIVYCRNVLIYFDQNTKTDILGRIRKLLPDDGYLSLGGSETVIGVSDAFKPITGQRGLYCPV